MTLRLRLTLLYTSIMGGALLLFGLATYGIVSFQLIQQVDLQLSATTNDEILPDTKIDGQGHISVGHPQSMDMNGGIFVQAWNQDGNLNDSSQNIAFLLEPLDPVNLEATEPSYRDSTVRSSHLRVLTVPLQVDGRIVGAVQVASSLSVVDAVRRDLVAILVTAAIVAMVLAALGSWFVVGGALEPLETITDVARQINYADDLSRRIPYNGPPDDEIGNLIATFNQTLERLETLFTSQRRFLADVSHELRTPLTVVKGNVDLMRRMKTIDDESLNSIDQEAGRLTRMVGDLLLLAKAESGELPLKMAPVALDTLLLEVFQEMDVLARGRLRLKITEIDQVQVNGDRDRLKQVLLNLVANAIQYTPSGGDVFLSLGKVGEQARLIVRDTGPGIPAEDLPHIFERFYRAEKSRTRTRSAGFGLGLSIANWIIQHHGGTIDVDSQEDQGTTFCIWLPLLKK